MMMGCFVKPMRAARVLTVAFCLSACAVTAALAHGHGAGEPKQAMFKTRQEAEAAAPGFGCTGAHAMGEMWMVCAKHGQAHPQGDH